MRAQCSHTSVGLAQARPNHVKTTLCHDIMTYAISWQLYVGSRTVLTDLSHELNLSEGKEKPTFAPKILGWLKALKVLDLAHKRT